MPREVRQANCVRCSTSFSYQWPQVRAKFCSRRCLRADWRERHRELLRNKNKEYTQRNREKRLETTRRYGNGNGREIKRRWYETNKARLMREKLVRYRTDPNFRRLHMSRAKAHKLLTKSSIEQSCLQCGNTKSLHCHHINFDPFDNRISNLVWLCHWCHMRLHAEAREEKT